MATTEEENYIRISMLLIGMSPRAVRAYFDTEFDPSRLERMVKDHRLTLKELKDKRVINKSQWDLLFSGTGKPDSKTFDVTLLITLLKHLASVSVPDQLPDVNDYSIGADLGRIKFYRNQLAHLDDSKIDNRQFEDMWTTLTEAIKRLGGIPLYEESMRLKHKVLDISNLEIMWKIKHASDEIKNLRQDMRKKQADFKRKHEALNMHCTSLIIKHKYLKKDHSLLKKKSLDPVQWNIRGTHMLTTEIAGDIAINHVDIESIDRNYNGKTDHFLRGTLMTKPLIVNGYAMECIVDARLERNKTCVDGAICKGTNLLTNLEDCAATEFESILICADPRKSCTFDFYQLLEYAVQKKQEMFCRFILSNLAKNPNVTSLLQILKHGFDKGAVGCCKAMAWFITRTFYKIYRSTLIDVDDIWPAFRCICTKTTGTRKGMCSSDIRIIVEHEGTIPGKIDYFYEIPIMQILSYESKEGKGIHDYLQMAKGLLHFRSKIYVNSKEAEVLFNDHAKLTLISPSSYKSTGYKQCTHWTIKKTKCLHFYCRVKGFIPVGEDHFPSHYCGLPTDIIEGCPRLCNNIKVGSTVGGNTKLGTLGGFIKIMGDTSYLTCAHVLFSTEQLASNDMGINHLENVYVDIKYPLNFGNQPVQIRSGKVRDVCFRTDSNREISIDAALVKVKKMITIDPNDYISDTCNLQATYNFHHLGMQSIYLNDSCIDYKWLCFLEPKPTVKTIVVGAVSGMLSQDSKIVEPKQDCDTIFLEYISDSFWNVMQSDIKSIAEQLIQSFQREGQRDPPTNKQIIEKFDAFSHLINPFHDFKKSVCEVVSEYFERIHQSDIDMILDDAICRRFKPYVSGGLCVLRDNLTAISKRIIEGVKGIGLNRSPTEQDISQIFEKLCQRINPSQVFTRAVCDVVSEFFKICQQNADNGSADSILGEATCLKTRANYSAIVENVHIQNHFLRRSEDRQMAFRTQRRMYGQLNITNIPSKPGDSGACIYATYPNKGCLGMLIGVHPDQRGCIATPISEVLDSFNIKLKH